MIFDEKNLHQKFVSDINHYMLLVPYEPKNICVERYGASLQGVYTTGTFVVYINWLQGLKSYIKPIFENFTCGLIKPKIFYFFEKF